MAAIGALGPIGSIGAFASPAGLSAAPLAPAGTAPAVSSPGAARAAPSAVPPASLHAPQWSDATRNGLDALEALAILALLSGRHRNHGADALSAMVVTLALNAYTGVQALGSNPAAGAAPAGAGLNLRT